MNRRRLLWIAAFVLAFVAGGIAGSVATQAVLRSAFRKSLQPETWTAAAEKKLSSRLQLTAPQQQQVHGILRGMGNEFRQIFCRALDESGLTIVQAGQRIDAILTPEQQRIHADLKARLRQRLSRDLHLELPPDDAKPLVPPNATQH